MGHFFLPIIFENLFFPLDRKYFYLLGWICSLAFFHTKIFLFKRLLFIYVFAVVYFVLILFNTYDVEIIFALNEIEHVFLAVIMLEYFLLVRDFLWLRNLLIICLCFVAITVMTTLVGLQKNPLAARSLMGGLGADLPDLIVYYRSIGIADYGFFYGVALLIPVLISFVRMNQLRAFVRWLFLGFAMLCLYGIFKAQFTGALLFSTSGAVIAFWADERMGPAVIRVSVLFAVLILLPIDFIAEGIKAFALTFGSGMIQDRLLDFAFTLKHGILQTGSHVDQRLDRIPVLLEYFSQDPLFGVGQSLKHNWWFDRLALFGITGIIPWLLIFGSQIRYNFKIMSPKNRIYYLIPVLLFAFIGLVKNLGQKETMLVLFFIIPILVMMKDNMFKTKQAKVLTNV